MRLLVTGGAGFIGSHYVRSLLTGCYPGFEDAEVTVLDKLTYAGNLANLAPVADTPRYRFVQGDICDPAALEAVVPGHDAVVHFAAESHVDRSIIGAADFVHDQRPRHPAGLRRGAAAPGRQGRARLHRRGLRLDRRGVLDRGPPLEPNSPYSAAKAGADLLARAYARTHGLDVSVTRCSNNYGPYQFPEKVIPLFVTNLIDGKHGAAVRRRAQRPRLAARRRPLPGHPAGARARRAGRVLQHRRRPRADQQGAHRPAAARRPAATGSSVEYVTDRRGPRPALLGRPQQDRPSWATGRGTRSRTAWPRRSPGTGTTATGGSR